MYCLNWIALFQRREELIGCVLQQFRRGCQVQNGSVGLIAITTNPSSLLIGVSAGDEATEIAFDPETSTARQGEDGSVILWSAEIPDEYTFLYPVYPADHESGGIYAP